MARFPPGPRSSLFDTITYRPARDPIAFFGGMATYGDLSYVRLGREHLFLAIDPAVIKDVLVTQNQRFHKNRGLERAKPVFGEGLLTSEDEFHLRQRRLIQPAFHRQRIANYATTMVAFADRAQRGWTDRATLDIASEMSRLTLLIVAKTLLDADVDAQTREIGDAMNCLMDSFWTMMLPFGQKLEWLPIPYMRRARRARLRLDEIIYGIIRERRTSGGDRGDLLSMLLLAQDDEVTGTGMRGMTDRQVRDEAMTIFLAGHETTANALAWTWYLLSKTPDVERRVHEEVDQALSGRLPTIADVERLPYTTRVITESMRLYPPAWLVGRRSVDTYQVDGYNLPVRSLILMPQWIVHRDARHYADPERFDPDRWTTEFKAQLPQFAYFPFGGGPRRCIGESFAWMELVLVLATIAQRWTFELVPDHPVVPQAAITLRPRHGIRMIAVRRGRL